MPWSYVSSSSSCVPRCSSKISSSVYARPVGSSCSHHACVREVPKPISNDGIPVVDATSMEKESRSMLLFHLLESSFFVGWMIKDDVFLESGTWHDLIIFGQELKVISVCTHEVLHELVGINGIFFCGSN